jgi:hypothetical protein
LSKNRRIAREQLRYSQIIGSLMYLTNATRPDISYVVSKLSRFVKNPRDTHLRALESDVLLEGYHEPWYCWYFLTSPLWRRVSVSLKETPWYTDECERIRKRTDTPL